MANLTLESGKYFISSFADTRVGRFWAEDFSMGPKPVVFLPEGLQAPDGFSPVWEIEKKDGGYILKIGGNHTAVIDDKVFAILLEGDAGPPAVEWVIVRRPEQGPDVYSIEVRDTGRGWVALGNIPMTQVAVHPHIVLASFPPQFPLGQLFKITPANE
ncbi:hypothetical protein C8Q75DRAFT_362301 [Abortiporus biennis]|nr:hypothetical protein C8Q75DRAFT_362301 [Abortiporus biennis]